MDSLLWWGIRVMGASLTGIGVILGALAYAQSDGGIAVAAGVALAIGIVLSLVAKVTEDRVVH